MQEPSDLFCYKEQKLQVVRVGCSMRSHFQSLQSRGVGKGSQERRVFPLIRDVKAGMVTLACSVEEALAHI